MVDVSKIQSVYFIGIGGIGMSALARYFKKRGLDVEGYDRNPTWLTQELISEGINVVYDEKIPFPEKHYDLVIYTSAIPENNTLLRHYRSKGYDVMKRSKVLGLITENKFTIAVAGTHGKTTITSMIAHIMKSAGTDMSSFVGGITKNYDSNYISSEGDGMMVVEADEYDRSFLSLSPDISIISSIDPDHLDVYETMENLQGSFEEFAARTDELGYVILKEGLDLKLPGNINVYRYGIEGNTEFRAENITDDLCIENFTLILGEEKIDSICLPLPGKHNIENAVAAAAVCHLRGISGSEIKKALQSYEGVHRRYDFIYENNHVTYIDDYAHHPEELSACIRTTRKLFPGKKITGIFQPHLYSRTRNLATGFAESLDKLDEIILLYIYPAREEPIPGISSEIIYKKMANPNKVLLTKNQLMDHLWEKDFEILLTLGAGDIDQYVELIDDMLKQRNNNAKKH